MSPLTIASYYIIFVLQESEAGVIDCHGIILSSDVLYLLELTDILAYGSIFTVSNGNNTWDLNSSCKVLYGTTFCRYNVKQNLSPLRNVTFKQCFFLL